mgnify:CR=1 FL=1
MIVADENLINIFNLYLGIDYLYSLLSSESFLVFFWLHFLALNIFLGSYSFDEAKVKAHFDKTEEIDMLMKYFN